MTGKSSARQYSITWRKSFAVAIGRPSAETATIPASFIAAISASASPLLPTDAAPMGHTRTGETAAARSTIDRVSDALSFTGRVFGMGHTAVNPPRAAARVPVSIVSEDSPPGSQVAMQIDKSGRDDQILGFEYFRALGARSKAGARRDRGDAISIEQNISRRIGACRGIEHASIANQQHVRSPFRRACPPPRQLSGTATPCARQVRS